MRRPPLARRPLRAVASAAAIALFAAGALAPLSCSLSTEGADFARSSGASGSGPRAPEPEICSNGVDDDLDGAIDCADEGDCGAQFTCEAAGPPGWTGYFRVVRAPFTGAPSDPPPCADGSAPRALFAGPAGPTECSQCACAWPEAKCTAPPMDCFDGETDCTNGVDFSVMAATTDCIYVENLQSCQLTGPAQISKADVCVAKGGELKASLAWAEEIFVCGGPGGGGCGEGEACVAGGGATSLCIEREGEDPCPAGWTTTEIQAFAGGDDARGCAPCSCGSSATCGADGHYTIYDGTNCNNSSEIVGGLACADVSNKTAISGSIAPKLASVKPGKCIGGGATGELTTKGALKICCR